MERTPAMNDTDLEILRKLVAAGDARHGAVVSRLGYFCAPFRPADGPFSDHVIKIYRGLRDATALDRLAAAHEAYVSHLRAAGVRLPATDFVLLPEGATRVPVIVQRALPADSMLRARILAATPEDACRLVASAIGAIHAFWSHAATWSSRIGFHPSIRNYALEDGKITFLDTFPPLIDYSREEMGDLLLAFSTSPWMRTLGPLLPGTVRRIQDEWYTEAGNLTGLVGSAVRLRPEDAEAILEVGRDFAEGHLTGATRAEVMAELSRPPRLPGYWTATRRALGLEGAGNV